jgi:hypothetical protein
MSTAWPSLSKTTWFHPLRHSLFGSFHISGESPTRTSSGKRCTFGCSFYLHTIQIGRMRGFGPSVLLPIPAIQNFSSPAPAPLGHPGAPHVYNVPSCSGPGHRQGSWHSSFTRVWMKLGDCPQTGIHCKNSLIQAALCQGASELHDASVPWVCFLSCHHHAFTCLKGQSRPMSYHWEEFSEVSSLWDVLSLSSQQRKWKKNHHMCQGGS